MYIYNIYIYIKMYIFIHINNICGLCNPATRPLWSVSSAKVGSVVVFRYDEYNDMVIRSWLEWFVALPTGKLMVNLCKWIYITTKYHVSPQVNIYHRLNDLVNHKMYLLFWAATNYTIDSTAVHQGWLHWSSVAISNKMPNSKHGSPKWYDQCHCGSSRKFFLWDWAIKNSYESSIFIIG